MRTTKKITKSNAIVSIISKGFVVAFVVFCAAFAESAGKIFSDLSSILLYNMKWFTLTAVSAMCFFLIYVMCSRYGLLKIGKDTDKPEYGYFAWMSMLFSCAMGVGLIFWSVAEPMNHYAYNPFTKGLTDEAASMAMQISYFHWGLHAWSIYCLSALAIAYFSFRKGLPFSLRAILHPLIGDRIYGAIGNVVDILVIVITTFGISQTLAIGVLQINAGLHKVFNVEISVTVQFILMISLSAIATISVVRGIGTGMRRLSELNIILSLFLISVLMLIGPARYITNSYLEGIGNYTANFVELSLWSDAQKDSEWQNWWTAFYWLWWPTWGPFVGMFIAKISKGRTIRQLISGVLIIPTLATFFWFAVFGGYALKIEQETRISFEKEQAAELLTNAPAATKTTTMLSATTITPETVPAEEFKGGKIVQAIQEDNTIAVFELFKAIDSGVFSSVLSVAICLLLVTYLVTSQDAGTHVLCFLDVRSEKDTPIRIRIIWSLFVTAISLGLLYAGGLKTIQAAVILFGFPIIIFLVISMIALMRAFKDEDITRIGSVPVKDSKNESKG